MNQHLPLWWPLCLAILLLSPLCAVAQSGDSPAVDSIGSFDIVRFDVEGNTLLDAPTVQALVAEFAGRNRDFGFVERAMDALQGAYRARGFGLVRVILPEQELNQGVVRLEVVEAWIRRVRVEGNVFHDEANIRNSLPGLREGEVPNTERLSASLKIANENPSKKTTLQVQGGAVQGSVDAILQVADEKTWGAGLTLDNSGSGQTGRGHISAQYQNFNVGGIDHVFSFQYTTSVEHPSKVSVYGAGYRIPLYASGDSLDFYASHSNVNAGTVSAGLFNLAVSGQGTVFGGRYNHTLARNGDFESKLTAGFERKAYRNNVDLAGLQLGNNVTVNPASLSYIGDWTLPAGNINFFLTGVRNLPGGANGGDADFSVARSGAPASYSLLRYGAGYTQSLPGEWLMRLSLNGQATRDALVAGEQFGVGGAFSVRGLREREIANDRGVAVNAELYTPDKCTDVQGGAVQCRLLGFYDAGRVARNHALPGEQTHASVASAGVGMRLNAGKSVAMQLDYARVLNASDPQLSGERRVHFRMALTF